MSDQVAHRLRLNAVLGVVAVAAGLAALVGSGWAVLDHRRGPASPGLEAAATPAAVEWLWAGGTTTERTHVVAKVAGEPTSVELLVSDSVDLAAARRLRGTTIDAGDGTVTRFAVSGLSADHEYHYALDVDGLVQATRAGRLRTMPHGPASFTFAFSACAETGSNHRVFDTIQERDPLFYINTGDFHYGDIKSNSPERFRREFDRSLAAPAQGALYRSTSTVYTWDDHDFGGNSSSSVSASRPAAQQVYREYVPHHPLAADEIGDDGVYHSFVVGRVRFVVTDLRSHRSPHDMPDGPAKTMLGTEQRDWFERQLRSAAREGQAVIWVSSTPWIGRPKEGGDGWNGYTYERGIVAEMISALELTRQFVMLGGDAHMVALDDGTNSDYSGDQTGGFPSLQAAALDRRGSVKGGPYSHGTYPGRGQFGEVEVHDDGQSVEVVLRGLTYEGDVLVEESFDVTPRRAGIP